MEWLKPGRLGFQTIWTDFLSLTYVATWLEKWNSDAENSALVYWCSIKSQRQSFGWGREEWLYCFAKQRGTQEAHDLKNWVSQPGGIWWEVL